MRTRASNRLVVFILAAALWIEGHVQGAIINFQTRVGETYAAETSSDLQSWTPVGNSITGDGNVAQIPFSSPSSPSFYRVRFESPFTFDHLSLVTNSNLDDLKTSFTTGNWKYTAKAVLRRAVPDAGWIVDNDPDPNFFYFWFAGDPPDFTQMLFRLSSAVHETVHHVGFNHMTFQNDGFVNALAMGGSSFFSVPAMNLFPRSEILNSLPPDMQTLGYANTYLTGQSGGQDIVNFLDEFNAYTFTTLVDTAVLRYLTGLGSISSRDGVLAMMLFVQEYLKVARERHPTDYEKIISLPVAELTVILWDRAERLQ
jgi:hypothetical protein